MFSLACGLGGSLMFGSNHNGKGAHTHTHTHRGWLGDMPKLQIKWCMLTRPVHHLDAHNQS